MSTHYSSDVFFSMSGLQKDRFLLDKTGRLRYSVVLTEENTGALRVIHLDIGRADKNPSQLYINGHYLLHAGKASNYQERFLEAILEEKDGLVFLNKANFLGYPIDHTSQDQIFSFTSGLNQLIEHVARKHEWTNFIRLFERAGINIPTVRRPSIPGLHPNGEIKSYTSSIFNKNSAKTQNHEESKEPVYPALFFHSIAGCGPEHYSGEEKISHSFTVKDEETNKLYVWTYNYAQGKTPLHVDMSCTLSVYGKGETETRPLYKLSAQPAKGQKGSVSLKSMEIYHPNARSEMEKIDLSNDQVVADALKSIRMYNRDIRAGMLGMEEDFRRKPEHRRFYYPSDILMLTGLTKSLTPSPSVPKNGRFVFTPLGGQNNREIVSSADKNIGGNSYRFDYYTQEKKKPDSILMDTGALFHDKFDLTFSNIGKYLRHRYNKSHEPEFNTQAILLTHGHEDHVGALPYLVKAGYILPLMIMPPETYHKIKRGLHALKIDKKIRQEILGKIVVVENSSIPANATEEAPFKTSRGKEEISLFWERLPGEKLGEYFHYPVAKIGNFKVRIGPMPHSLSGCMYEVISPAGGHLHTGDFKLDPTIKLPLKPLFPWLSGVTSKSVSGDSTGTTRKQSESTPTEELVGQSIVKLFKEYPDKRFICPVLGSNTARITTLIAAMGQAGREFLVVDGKALEDLIDDLQKIYGIKEWAKRVYGVTIAKQGSKEAKRIYEEEAISNYVITATGTQDEPYSSMNRAIRDWLPPHRFRLEQHDLIVPLQGPIPVGKNRLLRKSAKYFAEIFHGCKYILPEEIEKESDLVLAGSGHASPQDLIDFYKLLPRTVAVAYPVHGGPEQLQAGKEIAELAGLRSYIINNFEGYETLKDGTAQLFRREIGEMVGIKNKLPTAEQFYLKRNFTSTLIPIKPRDPGQTGILLRDFENALSKNLGHGVYNETEQNMGFSLSRTFNISSANGYLTGRYAFGTERYGKDVYRSKRIGGQAALDTETTGTDPAFDHVDQFSLAMWGMDKRLVFEEELRQTVPGYHTRHPEALMITNTNPMEEKEGDASLIFSDKIVKTFHRVKDESKKFYILRYPDEFRAQPTSRIKSIIVAHNFKFDDRFIRKTLGENLLDRVRPHSTDGNIAIDTRHVARALHAIHPDKFNVRKKKDSTFLDFTLKALCEENGVPYDDRKAHASALYDAHRAMYLFWKMEKVAPELVAQMILNADSTTGHLLNDMMGVDTGFEGTQPVFSYVSPRADRPDLRLGSFVGTVGGGRYAVIMNMTKSSKDIFGLTADDLVYKLIDPSDDSLELIDLRNNPMIFPPKFFYQKNNSRKFPKETIDRRAHALKDHLNYMSPYTGWQNMAERIESVWKERQNQVLTTLHAASQPDLRGEARMPFREKDKIFERSIFQNLSQRAHATFNPVQQKIFNQIKTYREEVLSVLNGNEANVGPAYKDLIHSYGLTEEQALLINNIHYDINPLDMTPEALRTIDGYRSYHAAQTTQRAVEALERLEKDPDRVSALIGNSTKKKKLFTVIKTHIGERSSRFKHNDLSRDFAHPWRRHIHGTPELNAA